MAYGGGGFRRGGFRRDFGPREMHKIICSECGNEGEVPFKPREGTPVLCKDCFMKKKGIKPRIEEPAESEESEKSEESDEEKSEEAGEEEAESEE